MHGTCTAVVVCVNIFSVWVEVLLVESRSAFELCYALFREIVVGIKHFKLFRLAGKPNSRVNLRLRVDKGVFDGALSAYLSLDRLSDKYS